MKIAGVFPGLALVAGVVAATSSFAAESFSGGKNMRIVVGSSAGAGFDAFGRMVGRHLGAHIPGKPSIVVSNMPGAGSFKAVQSLKAAPTDGTYIVLFNPGLVLGSLLTPNKVKADFSKDVHFIGSATADARVCHAWHTTGVKTFQDLLKKSQFSTGHTGNSASTYLDAAILKNVFGAKIKQIVGYPGATEQRLAVERGELDGDCGTWESVPPHWLAEKKTNIFIRISKVNVPELKGIPHISEFANDEQKQIIDLVTTHNLIFRPFIVSSKVPMDKVAVLRESFWKTIHDKALIDESIKTKRGIIDPLRGEDVAKMVEKLYATPKNLIPKAAAAIK
jgi:tripartite-type tricarboxylate transporter receptor subunit TctC